MKKLRVELKSGRIAIIAMDKLDCIYRDGSFSSRGVDVYATQKGTLVAVPWSKWQGEDPMPFELSVKDFCKYPHWDRVVSALERANFPHWDVETEEI